MIKKRAGWLAILFVGEMFTATAMGFFEEEIAKAVVLALFLPLIISSGGNSGSQATTLIIQAMALGEVKLRDWLRVIRRELISGHRSGRDPRGHRNDAHFHLAEGALIRTGHTRAVIALTFGLALIGVVTFGTLAGRFDFDGAAG